jgi:hypothetical protein
VRLLRRVGWAGVLVLGAFGVYFSFANYPWFGIAALSAIILSIGYSERQRREELKASESARRQSRA